MCLHDKLLWQRLEHLTLLLKHLNLLLSQRLGPVHITLITRSGLLSTASRKVVFVKSSTSDSFKDVVDTGQTGCGHTLI